MPHKKLHLATKDCRVCGRAFAWRKKWERDWNKVLYCSQRCRKASKQTFEQST
ncbi:DUF2256 domain-containing protein [Arenicella xantha]|uniref:DUF2256 domain-containing protein n=1 Tax=Arenicella xantha TaxID=644221 RepID=UPI000DE8E7C4